MDYLAEIYPASFSVLGSETFAKAAEECGAPPKPKKLQQVLAEGIPGAPPFAAELARLEWAIYRVKNTDKAIIPQYEAYQLNPALELLALKWRLVEMFSDSRFDVSVKPVQEPEWAVIWRKQGESHVHIETANDAMLLAIKLIVDEITPEKFTTEKQSLRRVYAVLQYAADRGILIPPQSHICRDRGIFPDVSQIPERYLSVDTFTLQWHVTHACDLHCKHCYDRSKRSLLTQKQATAILDSLESFCQTRHVRGHVCLSGGNPYLYPHFFSVYREAVLRGFSLSILGNPVAREKIEDTIALQPPTYFQVSLEGLREHNDLIRGRGHFDRVMAFLDVLREYEIESAVMLTLTGDNIDQVLPLAELLRNKADYFTFNRLSQVGEGVNLKLPTPEQYRHFLREYIAASKGNRIIGFKDNLINIELYRENGNLFDGCTGYGCGAAFNFVVVLPDGETHACRKIPSPIGNVLQQSFEQIFESDEAKRYRQGSAGCRGCSIRHVCGGCLAVTSGQGLNPFEMRDPFCFIGEVQ